MIISDLDFRPASNDLTLVRLVLASSVIVTHCYWRVHGIEGMDDLSGLLGVPLSVYAVDGFFFLSGFLVYQSLARRSNAGAFLVARVVRLWPALAVSVLGTVAGGYLITDMPGIGYFGGATARFVGNLSLASSSYSLTGVQCEHGLCNVNGSLWTLPWEARCYLVLAVLALVGLANRRVMARFVLPTTLAGALLWHVPAVQALVAAHVGGGAVYLLDVADRLWPLFALGIAAAVFRDRLHLSWTVLAVLFVANLIAHPLGLGLHVRALFIGYAVLCFGFLPARNGAISGHWPDLSYGMYIYAFPMMMGIAAIWPTHNYLALALANFALTVPLAALSWYWVEKPVLDLFRRRYQPFATGREDSATHKAPVRI